MSTTQLLSPIGAHLTQADFDNLERRWINPNLAREAGLRRISSAEGQEALGRKRGNCAGILIPYRRPGENRECYYRVRRDAPELEMLAGNVVKEKGKYLGPPDRGNRVYFPPGVTPEQLKDPNLLVVITEGEFKTLALRRLATHNAAEPQFLPLGLGGVWNWRGTIGKRNGPNGDRQDEKGPIPDLDLIAWMGRRVVIAYDADAVRNGAVQAARCSLAQELRSRGASVGYLEWPEEEGKGIDDRLAKVGPEKVLAVLPRVDFNTMTGWKAELLCTAAGKQKPLLENARIALQRAPEFEGLLAYDEFRQRVKSLRAALWGGSDGGWFWTEHDDLETACWLQRHGIEVSPETAGQAVQMVARQRLVHEVRDHLESLRWGGEERVDTWLFDYFSVGSAADSQEQVAYLSTVGRCWLISAVARVYKPGCKVDHVLILEGAQGIGKSRACRALAGEWFRDNLPSDLNDKDAALQLAGTWIIELSELDTLDRSERATIKAFLSRDVDSYRPPYGKRTQDVPRSCVFIGTTNSDRYLKDETGGRRFWPIRCGSIIDVEGLERDRDQLWAEAVVLYKAGATWWLQDEQIVAAAKGEQDARFDADPWQSTIEAKVASRDSVTVEQVLEGVLNLPLSAWHQSSKNRVAQCLQAMGWRRHQVRTGDKRKWVYKRAAV